MLSRPLIARFCWGMSTAATSSLAYLNFRRTFFWKPKQQFSRVGRPIANFSEVSKFKEVESFEELNIPAKLKQKLVELYPNTTEIQRKTMGIILGGGDLIGVAKTGSGKTLAYGLPTLLKAKQQCQSSRNMKQGPVYLVIAPTRELAVQIEEHLSMICKELNLKICTVYGGMDRFAQLLRMRSGCDVMIATPGRLLDFLNADKFTLDRVRYLTLDEADRILEVGYEEQILEIAKRLPKERQTTLFTATWEKKVQRVFSDYMNKDPEYVQVGDGQVSFNLDIKQSFQIVTGSREKLASLVKLLKENENQKFLVFINKKSSAEWLKGELERGGFSSVVLSGDLSQNQRTWNLNSFKGGQSTMLIATDVASRGLDINDISYVINFDFPMNVKTYIHRIGRTGRAGKQGKSVTFLDGDIRGQCIRELVDIHKKHNLEEPRELLEYLSISGEGYRDSRRNSSHHGRSSHYEHRSGHQGERSQTWRNNNRDNSRAPRYGQSSTGNVEGFSNSLRRPYNNNAEGQGNSEPHHFRRPYNREHSAASYNREPNENRRHSPDPNDDF